MRLSSATDGAFASLADFDARTRGGVGAGFISSIIQTRSTGRKPLMAPTAVASTPRDISTVTETLVLHIIFVKQCDQPDAPTGVPCQGPRLDSPQPRGPPKPMQPILRTRCAQLEAARTPRNALRRTGQSRFGTRCVELAEAQEGRPLTQVKRKASDVLWRPLEAQTMGADHHSPAGRAMSVGFTLVKDVIENIRADARPPATVQT